MAAVNLKRFFGSDV